MRLNAVERRVRLIIRSGALRFYDYIGAHAVLNAFAKRTLIRFFPRTNVRLRLAIHRGREIRLQEADVPAEPFTVNDLSPRALQVYLDLEAATTSRDERG
jgi:hypothetical protein